MVSKISNGNLETYHLDIRSSNISYAVVSTPNSTDKLGVSVTHNANNLNPLNAQYLFLASLGCSFLGTFLSLLRENKLLIHHYSCTVTGEIKTANKKSAWQGINMYPHIYLPENGDAKKIIVYLKKAGKLSFLLNALNLKTNIRLHPSVELISNMPKKNLGITINAHFAKPHYHC